MLTFLTIFFVFSVGMLAGVYLLTFLKNISDERDREQYEEYHEDEYGNEED